MLQNITPILGNAFSNLLEQGKAIICPFKELPATTRDAASEESEAAPMLTAVSLFSLFTADIINEAAVFTR